MLNRRNILKLIATSSALGLPKFAIGSFPGWDNYQTAIPLHHVARFSIFHTSSPGYDLAKLTLVCKDSEDVEFERHFQTENGNTIIEQDDEYLPNLEMYQDGDKFKFVYSSIRGTKLTISNLIEVDRVGPTPVAKKETIAEQYRANDPEIKRAVQEFKEFKASKMSELNISEDKFNEMHRQGDFKTPNGAMLIAAAR